MKWHLSQHGVAETWILHSNSFNDKLSGRQRYEKGFLKRFQIV